MKKSELRQLIREELKNLDEMDLEYNTEELQTVLDNEESLYNEVVDFMRTYTGRNPYQDFIEQRGFKGQQVPYNDFNFEDVDFDDMNDFLEKYSEF